MAETAQTVEHLYSPAESGASELVQLETTNRSLDVAMYTFTDRQLAQELAMQARHRSAAGGRLR